MGQKGVVRMRGGFRMASVRWMGLALLMLVGGTVQAGDYAKAMKTLFKALQVVRTFTFSAA